MCKSSRATGGSIVKPQIYTYVINVYVCTYVYGHIHNAYIYICICITYTCIYNYCQLNGRTCRSGICKSRANMIRDISRVIFCMCIIPCGDAVIGRWACYFSLFLCQYTCLLSHLHLSTFIYVDDIG